MRHVVPPVTIFHHRAAVLLRLSRSLAVTQSLLSRQPDAHLLSLDDQVRVNRLPGTNGLTCKLTLAQNHKIFQQRFGKAEFNFVPETFKLSETNQNPTSVDPEEQYPVDKVWIVKPLNNSGGRGIYLTCRPENVPPAKKGWEFLVQSYITDPYLINGHKFDLRVYVLLTGLDPLRMFLYKDGLVRSVHLLMYTYSYLVCPGLPRSRIRRAGRTCPTSALISPMSCHQDMISAAKKKS